jgi:hypothetical protein
MISPICVFRPIAGKMSEMPLMSRKIATIASSCGNICTSSSVSSPKRRPVKRIRDRAYAASAPRNTVPTAVVSPMNSVLRYQAPYG